MSSYNINVFISHSWNYSDAYDTLADWIFNANWSSGQASINFRNYSVPKDDPIHDADNATQLKNAIYQKIALSHVIVIPVRRHIKCPRLRPGLRETLLTSLVDIKRRLCGIASVDVRLSSS